MTARIWMIAGLFALLASPALAENPPNGVYDCFGPSMALGYSPDIPEGAGQGSVGFTSGGKFSILSPGVYLSRGNKAGHFSFDGLTLSMTDGPYAGLRYHKVPKFWTFRILRANGDEGPFMCPINTAKNPRTPNAW